MAISPRVWITPFLVGALVLAGQPLASADAKAPNPVTNVAAVGRDAAAQVSWRKPASGTAPKSYVVTSSPGNKQCTAQAPATSCVVRGLTNGRAYTFSVVAVAGGAKSKATRSSSVTPAAATLTVTGTLTGKLRKADGTFCPNGGDSWTVEMRSPGDRDRQCRLNVLAILADGRAYTSAKVQAATGAFTVAVPAPLAARRNLTLHITRADGSYVGPILLDTQKAGSKRVGVLGLGDTASGQQRLGTATLNAVGSLTAFAKVASFTGTRGTVYACLSGEAPAGAGKGGYVKRIANCTGSARSEAVQRDSQCANQSSGGDQDNDGIPSAVDVDDNGNGLVDISDPAVDGNCTVEPSKSLRTSLGGSIAATGGKPTPINYAAVVDGLITEEQFNDMLDEVLSGSEFGIGYYIFKTDFFPGADLDSDDVMPAVWITCAGVVWCDPATSRATLGTNVNMLNAEGVETDAPQPWFQYGLNTPWTDPATLEGSACSSDERGNRNYQTPCWSEITEPMRFGTATDSCGNGEGQARYQPGYAPTGIPADARNFFWTTVCRMSGGDFTMLRTVSGGSISPNLSQLETAVPAREAISAFDVLTLNYLSGGGVSSIATTLGAYPITAPMIRSFNGQAVNYNPTGDEVMVGALRGIYNGPNNAQRALVFGEEGVGDELVIDFNRPQREAFPGESSDSGLHDLHGMNYGIEIEIGGAQFGCGAANGSGGAPTVDSAYTVDPAMWGVRVVDGSYSSFLAPLRDTVLPDLPDEAPGVETLRIRLNLVECIQDRAAWLLSNYGIDVFAANLPNDAPVDGSATNWKGRTGLPNNGDQTCIQVNLNARGEERTGGTDSAIQGFCVQFAPRTFRSVAP